MARLMADFDCTAEDAAAVFGNAGHESAGLEKLQEIRPTVPGSRGGWGWFQWTGDKWAGATDPVIAHPEFTGTGTRFLQENGGRAIRGLFDRSFG